MKTAYTTDEIRHLIVEAGQCAGALPLAYNDPRRVRETQPIVEALTTATNGLLSLCLADDPDRSSIDAAALHVDRLTEIAATMLEASGDDTALAA